MTIALGLRNCNPEKASAVLLDMLAQEPAMKSEDWENLYGSVGYHLSEIGKDLPKSSVETIENMARQGNLRALQVLARIPQDAGRNLFLSMYSTSQGAAQRIAFQGIAWKYAGQSLSLLLEAVESDDTEIQSIAIGGLGNVKDSRAVSALLKLLKGPNAELAARSLERSGPGEHVEAVLQELLSTNDDSISLYLVRCLEKHKFTDLKICQAVVKRLEGLEQETQDTHFLSPISYHLIMFLQYLSGNVMGPIDSDEYFRDNYRQWLPKWKEWCQKQ
jgi:HEAT repeat protein